MNVFKLFIQEVKNFSKKNWWIYIIYSFLLLATALVSTDDLSLVIVITTLHFIADIFMMMMFQAYSMNKHKNGAYFQIVSLIIFLSIKIYTGLTSGHWVYIIADPIFILAALKNYQVDVKKSDIRVINFASMTILSGLIFSASLIAKYYFELNQFRKMNLIEWNLLLGLFLFAIGLATTGNEQRRYILAVLGLSLIVFSSFLKTFVSLYSSEVHGLEISYAILPLTVLFYNLKLWKKVFSNNDQL